MVTERCLCGWDKWRLSLCFCFLGLSINGLDFACFQTRACFGGSNEGQYSGRKIGLGGKGEMGNLAALGEYIESRGSRRIDLPTYFTSGAIYLPDFVFFFYSGERGWEQERRGRDEASARLWVA